MTLQLTRLSTFPSKDNLSQRLQSSLPNYNAPSMNSSLMQHSLCPPCSTFASVSLPSSSWPSTSFKCKKVYYPLKVQRNNSLTLYLLSKQTYKQVHKSKHQEHYNQATQHEPCGGPTASGMSYHLRGRTLQSTPISA